jgi:hypothetical protein
MEICATPIKGEVMRLVKLDTCGNPVTGAQSAVVVTDGFVSVNPSPQYEDGEQQQVRKANGAFCVNQQDPPELSNVQLPIQWCVVDPDAIVIVTGERLLLTNGVTGSGVAFGGGLITARFSLEIWQRVTGRGACDSSGQQRYVYWAFPNVGNTQVNDLNIENAPMQFATTSTTDGAATLWGDGPGSGGPWFEGGIVAGEHFLFNITTVAPPTPPASCGATLLS